MNTGSKMVYRDLKFKPGHSTNISVALVLLASIGPAGAFGFTFSNGGPGEYSYPADGALIRCPGHLRPGLANPDALQR